jgi:hypothetical protein
MQDCGMVFFFNKWFSTIVVLLAIYGEAAAEAVDPLAPARQGFLECGTVDHVAKTCEEIAQYIPRPDGKYDLVSQQVLALDPQIVMTYKTLVFVQGELICSGLVAADFDFATFTVDGKKVGSDVALFYRNQMRDTWLQLQGKTSCMKFVSRVTGVEEVYYLDGVPVSGREPIKMQWVKLEDSFKLKGAN